MLTSLYPKSLDYLRNLGFNVGVAIVTENGNQKIEPQVGGYLTTLPSWVGATFQLIVQAPRNLNARVVSVSGKQRNIATKTLDHTPNNTSALFSKLVKNRLTRFISPQGHEILSTKHEGNNMRIVIAEDSFQMWEIAIVTRIINYESHFFLTVQKLYQGRMFSRDGNLHIPEQDYRGYKNWLDLQLLLVDMVDVALLKPFDPELTPSLPLIGKLGENEGQVLFFCLASGLGIVRTNQSPALMHWNQIVVTNPTSKAEMFAHVEQGQTVAYEEMMHDGRYWKLKTIYPL